MLSSFALSKDGNTDREDSEKSQCSKSERWNFDIASTLENKINKMSLKLDNIGKLIEKNEKSLNKDVEQISRDIHSLQLALHHVTDLHISRIKESCNCGFDVIKRNGIQSWIQRLKSSKMKFDELKRSVSQIKSRPNDFELQQIEKNIVKESLELSILVEMLESSYEHKIQLTPNYDSIIPKISSTMSELAIGPTDLNSKQFNQHQANINDKIFDSVLYIDLHPQKTNELRGCTILSSGKLVFSDYGNNRLLLFFREDTNVKLERIIPLKGNPFCVTAIDGDRIAITFQELKSLLIFDLNTDNVCREIAFPDPCTGISYCNDKLAVRVEGKGFFIIDPNSGETTHTIRVEGIHIPYVSLNDKRVYYANWKTGKVSCCEINGEHLWEFKNVILRSPNGIATDSFGNVFISGFSSNNVLIISRDGLSAKQICPTVGSLFMPLGIHYSTARDELLVTSASGYAVLYSVKNTI